MKKTILCLIGICLCSGLFSQDPPAKDYWTTGTAFTVAKHRWEPALFTLSAYGLSDKVEISAHPLMMFLMPQVNVKVGWGESSGIRFATQHGLLYPTLFMRLVAMSGTGGLISPELTIPNMIAVSNRVLVSFRPFRNSILTGHAGITFSLHSATPDNRSTIDLPVIYPRLAVFYSQPEFDLGIDFRGKFRPRLGWLFSVENFILAGTAQNYFLENKGVLAYTSSTDKLRVEAGYKLCFGKYPDGPRWHLLPDINLIFAIGK
jgi:hypothetical protein